MELFGRDGRPHGDADGDGDDWPTFTITQILRGGGDVGGDGDAWPPFTITQILNGGVESYGIEKKGTKKPFSPTYQAGDLVRAWHKETNG